MVAHSARVDSPYREAMALVAQEERELAGQLAEYAENGPANIVCTRLQYTLEEPGQPVAHSADAALENVTRVNRALAAILRDLTEKLAPDTVCESLEAFRLAVDAVNRRISMILVTARDL